VADTNTDATQAAWPRWLAGLSVLVGLVAATVMTVTALVGMTIPGCGEGSGCAQAAASAWGSVPGLGWPVSHVGMAYFLALAVALAGPLRGQPIPAGVRVLAWVAALASVVYSIVMLTGGYACPYCIAIHLANFGVLIGVEFGAKQAGPGKPALVAGAMTFVVATAGQLVTSLLVERNVEQAAETALEESTSRMVAGEGVTGFTGRWRQGPAEAPIRIVIFSDYQCIDCRRIEAEVRGLIETRDDISVSAKHFPMCADCNRYATTTLHPNACSAAQAAEAAGIIGGNDLFWRMHHWLFDRRGGFTRPELMVILAEWGIDATRFEATMGSPEVDLRVRADIDEAYGLGLHFTPMIFINGVELKGWNAQNAVTRAVERVAATSPAAATPEADRPPTALEKYVNDWREAPRSYRQQDSERWLDGSPDAAVRITLWGDYAGRGTAETDRRLRAIASGREDVTYAFRHYPLDTSCNPAAASFSGLGPRPGSCVAARAAEAAGAIGGVDGFWKMHDWLLENGSAQLTEAQVLAGAAAVGLDGAALLTSMASGDAASTILDDVRAGQSNSVRGIPMIVINGRRVPRWNLQGHDVLTRIAEVAATGQ
jgi:protein-disulfide isomerase/uncharacterized membrane protein